MGTAGRLADPGVCRACSPGKVASPGAHCVQSRHLFACEDGKHSAGSTCVCAQPFWRVMVTTVCSGARPSRPRLCMWRWPRTHGTATPASLKARGPRRLFGGLEEPGRQYNTHRGGCTVVFPHQVFLRNENKDGGDALPASGLGSGSPGLAGDEAPGGAPWVPSPPPSPCPCVSCARCQPAAGRAPQ